MCKAIQELRAEERAQGITIGEERGMLQILIPLVRDGILTFAEAAKRANMTVDQFCAKTGLKPVVH